MDVDAGHIISNIAISQAQREVEQTPSDPFLPPKAVGSYKVDQSVIAGIASNFDNLTTVTDFDHSFPCSWNGGRTCSQLWRIFVGQDREDLGSIALGREEALFLEGLACKTMTSWRTLTSDFRLLS